MELTATQWILVAFGFVIGTVVALVVDEFSKKRDVPTIPRGLMDALVFVGVGLLVSGMLVAPLGEALGLRTPPTPAPIPTPGPTPANVGYVMTVTSDKLAKNYIEGATVGVYLSSPIPGGVNYAIASKSSDANGGAFFELPGLTSGTVYVMSSKDGYYSEVASTTIPGPQVYPTESLWAKLQLVKIGTPYVNVENLTPNIDWTGTEVLIMGMENTEIRAKLTLTCPTPKAGIKDPVIVFQRGTGWLANSPYNVSIEASGSGVTVSEEGDLATDYVETIKVSGVLTGTAKVEITMTLYLETPVDNTSLMLVSIDDLGGLQKKGYAGETGADLIQIPVLVVIP